MRQAVGDVGAANTCRKDEGTGRSATLHSRDGGECGEELLCALVCVVLFGRQLQLLTAGRLGCGWRQGPKRQSIL